MSLLPVKTAKTAARESLLFQKTLKASQREEQAIILLQLQGKEKEASLIFRAFTECLERTLLEESGDPYLRFEAALKQLNGILQGSAIASTLKNVSAIVAFELNGGTVHLSQSGDANGYLVRRGIALEITQYNDDASSPGFLHISSGDLQDNDLVILSTARLLRTLTPAQIANLALRPTNLPGEICHALEREKEEVGLAVMAMPPATNPPQSDGRGILRTRRREPRLFGLPRLLSHPLLQSIPPNFQRGRDWLLRACRSLQQRTQRTLQRVTVDLQHPKKRPRMHLLILASVAALFLTLWVIVQVMTTTGQGRTRAELEQLVTDVTESVRTATNRHLMGDIESANAILERAEQQARAVIGSESGLFRKEALQLLERIKQKQEEIAAVLRLAPPIALNIASVDADISARGVAIAPSGEIVVHDRQNAYVAMANSISGPMSVGETDFIELSTPFKRYGTVVFIFRGGNVSELSEGTILPMKTDDPGGWIPSKAAETYLRYLYILSPVNNQIYKYERLSDRYGEPTEYNINGELLSALDLAIDGDVFILKRGGVVQKLLRGEVRPFSFRNLPEGVLNTTTKILKPSDSGDFYFLDPENSRIIITASDGESGESAYRKQYVLTGEDTGVLQDIAVDEAETTLYVLDEKRVYAIDLQKQ